jgi:hypothetical protein
MEFASAFLAAVWKQPGLLPTFRDQLDCRCAKPRYNPLADINLNPRALSLVSDRHELHNGLQINP